MVALWAPPSPLAYFSLIDGNKFMVLISPLDEVDLIQVCKHWRLSCFSSTWSYYGIVILG